MTDRFDQIAVRAAVTAVPDPVTDDLRTRLRQLPVTLRRCGLPATLAMLMAREQQGSNQQLRAAYGKAAAEISKTVGEHLGWHGDGAGPLTPEQLLRKLGDADPVDYATATRYAELITIWLKRLAEARYQQAKARPAGTETDPDGQEEPS